MKLKLDKDVRKLLMSFPVEVSRSKKHIRVRHKETGRFTFAPVSGSDWRGIHNLKSALKLLSAEVKS